MLKLTYKYRLYPTSKQASELESTLNTCRFVYNSALQERRDAWKGNRVGITYLQQAGELVDCKAEIPELNDVHSQVLQATLKKLDRAFQNFFRRVKARNGKAGYPRFKGKNHYHSFTYPQSGFGVKDGKLHLSKIGDIKIKLHRPIKGEVKTLTITREVDKWYACFSVEVPAPRPKPIKSATGVDVGLTSFATLSNGKHVDNPKWFRDSERKLARAQKSLSRKKLRSRNRNRQRVEVAKLHERVVNQRKDFHHKLSRQLVNTYDLIAYEDLNIKGMVRNHHLAKSISDAGWGQFIQFVSYKAEYAGGLAIGVNPSGTSINCSACGFPVAKSLATRVHECPNCGLVMDRDENAALNILARALPQGLRDVKPVELLEVLPKGRQATVKQEAIGFNRW